MRDKIAKLIRRNYHDRYPMFNDTADQILELINAERCVWRHEEVWYPCLYYTSCGKFYREEYAEDKPYCPFCSKRVEVKDG